MTMSSSVVPQKFCGLRVLLVESDRMSLQVHANILNQNSYRVTITTEASKGLSMIMDGHTYDCVLIDADICKTDMDAFLHEVLKHRPQMSIILMASEDIHLRINREALESEAVHCLLKPCCPTDICNIWKHISRNRSSCQENVSMETLHTEDQVDNNVIRDDPRVKQSAINGSTVINNNISSGNFTEQVTNGDLFPNDDNGIADDQEDVHEITTKENIGTCATKKADKGKQPLIPVEDDKLSKKRKEFKTRVSWKGELEEKFINALRELGAKAHSSAILEHMNVPGLTRHHVASHLQKYHKRRKLIEASIAENIANERWLSTHSNNSASIIQSSSLLKLPRLNLSGILYVGIKKIMARLQEARPLPVPHPTTTPSNNYCGDQATDHSLRVVESSNSGGHGTEIQQAMEPQVTCKISSQYPFGEAMAPLGVENSNSGRQGTKIQQIGHDYENAMEPQVPGELSSHHPFGEAIAPLGVENSTSGGQGNEIQLRRHVHENAMEPQVPGEFSSHHPFGEAMAPLGVENSNDVGQGIEVQLKGHGYGNAMEPQVTGELASCHAFGEAVAPLGVESFSNGGQGTEYQLISQDHAMELQVTSEISYHAFGEAVAPLGVENTNNGGQGTEYQLIGHDYGNAMEPQVTSEISSCHAFEEAVAPSGVENSNKGGQGTEYQLIGQNYGNAMEPQVTSEISSYRAFGEATAPFSVEDYINYDGQGNDVQLIGNDYGNAIEPQVTAEASSHHAYGEPMSPLGVGANAASDNNLGMDVNSLHSSLNNRNFGDASGSGLGEVQVQVSCSGPATDPCVADCEGDAGLLNDSLEGLDWPDFFSFDAEGRLCPSQEAHVNRLNDSLEGLDWPDFFSFDAEGRLCASHDAHVNRENLGLVSPRSATHLNVENQINPGSNPDSIQPASSDFSFREFPIEEDDSLAQTQLPVNSGVPLDGSQTRFIDNDLSQSDLENAMSLFDDDDGFLFDGLFYF